MSRLEIGVWAIFLDTIGSEMRFSKMTPYQLGESCSPDAIPRLREFLRKGSASEKRLAASAVRKLSDGGVSGCISLIPDLVACVKAERREAGGGQVRQYALAALARVGVPYSAKQVIERIAQEDEAEYNRKLAKKVLSANQWLIEINFYESEWNDVDEESLTQLGSGFLHMSSSRWTFFDLSGNCLEVLKPVSAYARINAWAEVEYDAESRDGSDENKRAIDQHSDVMSVNWDSSKTVALKITQTVYASVSEAFGLFWIHVARRNDSGGSGGPYPTLERACTRSGIWDVDSETEYIWDRRYGVRIDTRAGQIFWFDTFESAIAKAKSLRSRGGHGVQVFLAEEQWGVCLRSFPEREPPSAAEWESRGDDATEDDADLDDECLYDAVEGGTTTHLDDWAAELAEELFSSQDDWARSDEEGWFYE